MDGQQQAHAEPRPAVRLAGRDAGREERVRPAVRVRLQRRRRREDARPRRRRQGVSVHADADPHHAGAARRDCADARVRHRAGHLAGRDRHVSGEGGRRECDGVPQSRVLDNARRGSDEPRVQGVSRRTSQSGSGRRRHQQSDGGPDRRQPQSPDAVHMGVQRRRQARNREGHGGVDRLRRQPRPRPDSGHRHQRGADQSGHRASHAARRERIRSE